MMDMSQTPKLSTIADRAVLVRLSRSMYQPFKFDKAATDEIEAKTGVRGAGRYNKRLFRDCAPLANTLAAFTEMYRYVNANTVPWLDDGVRMLPNALYFDFTDGLRQRKQAAESEVLKLVALWDKLVIADIQRLGPLGNPKDYPSSGELQDKFAINVQFLPVPTDNDFRLQITDEDKASLNNAIKEAEANVSKYLLDQMMEPLRRAAEKLKTPIGEEGHIFRDSMIENLVEAVERVKKLNLNGDATITQHAGEIEAALGKYTTNIDVLRESPIVRSQAQAKLDAILSKMGVQ